jgi:hypothetical protein
MPSLLSTQVGGEENRGCTWHWTAVVELKTLKPRKKNILLEQLKRKKQLTGNVNREGCHGENTRYDL